MSLSRLYHISRTETDLIRSVPLLGDEDFGFTYIPRCLKLVMFETKTSLKSLIPIMARKTSIVHVLPRTWQASGINAASTYVWRERRSTEWIVYAIVPASVKYIHPYILEHNPHVCTRHGTMYGATAKSIPV